MAPSSATDAGPVVLLRAYFPEPFEFSIEVLNPIIIRGLRLGSIREEIQQQWLTPEMQESDAEGLMPELISMLDQSLESREDACNLGSCSTSCYHSSWLNTRQ